MNKKLLKFLPLLGVLALSACGPAPSSGGGGKEAIDVEVTIKYVNSYGKNYQAQIDKMLEKFHEEHPKITVQEVKIGGYDQIHTQTVSDISAGNGEYGDLVICYPDHVVDYINYGVAVKLDDYIDDPNIGWTADEKADMIQGFLEEGKKYPVAGTYSLPYSKSTEALWYNADVVIGLNLSSVDPTINNGQPLTAEYIDNLTWEEFLDKLCPAIEAYNNALPADEKIIIDGGEGSLTGICGYDSTANLFINLCEQYGYGYSHSDLQTGKGVLDFDNANVKALMKKFSDAAKKNYIVPSTRIANNNYCSSYFTAQNLLFNIGSTAGVGHEHSDNFITNVTNIPGAAGGNKHVISQGPSLCLLSHPEDGKEMKEARIQAAWELYKFLSDTKNSASWALTVGYLPVRTSSLETEAYMDYASTAGKTPTDLEALQAKNAQYSTAASNNVFTSDVFKGSSTARTQVGALMSHVLNNFDMTDAEIDQLFTTTVNNIKLDMD